MNTAQYTGDWTQLVRELSPKQMRNALKRSYRSETKTVVGIAQRYLRQTGMTVRGDRSDWEKGIRGHIYSRGGGFLVTVKAHRASLKQMSQGHPGLSMHKNRRGWYKPVLMWAEDGTQPRTQRYKRKGYTPEARKEKVGLKKSGARHYVKTTGLSTGRLRRYGFLDKATPGMYRVVENDLANDLNVAVEKVAKKCGFIN